MYLSTLCYIEQNGCYLMLHRVKKEHDINAGKWIGVGGKFEADESPEECVLREVKEETGLVLTSWRFRGLVTFISARGESEYMSLWEGDRIFLALLEEERPFFSLKLVYDENDSLVRALLDGRELPLPYGETGTDIQGGRV